MSDLNQKHQPGNKHVTPWLGAYLDGEVSSALREQIETHLEGCLACQEELDSLEQLSSLLHSSPLPAQPTSDAAFARQVLERISQPVPPLWQRALRLSWNFAPLFLFAVWTFFQAVSLVSALLLSGLPWIPGAQAVQALLPGSDGMGSWLLGGLLSLVNLEFREAAPLVSWLEPVGVQVLLNLALLAVLAVLFLSWLASWWAYHRARALN